MGKERAPQTERSPSDGAACTEERKLTAASVKGRRTAKIFQWP